MTEEVTSAAETLGIKLHDQLIIGNGILAAIQRFRLPTQQIERTTEAGH